jgi:hypothetical protein
MEAIRRMFPDWSVGENPDGGEHRHRERRRQHRHRGRRQQQHRHRGH